MEIIMAAWSTSVRFSSLKLTDIQGLVRHEARSVDAAEVNHSNPDIVSARTSQNEVWVNDGTGNLVPASSEDQWLQVIEDRLLTVRNTRTLTNGHVVPVAMRRDATAVVDVVFMLDPDFTGKSADMTDDQRADVRSKLLVMARTMTDLVGAENVVGYSLHYDETNPHLHMMVTPIDDQRRLRWKSFVDGRAALGALHDVFRTDLRAAGYDATSERVDGGKRHLKLAEYKRQKDLERENNELLLKQRDELTQIANSVLPRVAELDDREAGLDARADALDTAWAEVPELGRRAREAGRAQGLKDAQAEVDQLRADAKQRLSKADERLSEADRKYQAAAAAQRVWEHHSKALEDELDLIEAIPSEFDRFLDAPLKNGTTLRPVFDRFTPQRQQRRARVERVIAQDPEDAPNQPSDGPQL